MPAQTIIKVRRDSAANWASTDPVLAAGEHGFETDTGKFKIGDGTTHYILLDYATDWANVTEKPTSFTPSAHAATHATGGGDAITIGQSQVTDLTTDLAAKATNPMTAVGDLIIGGTVTSGVAAPTRLAIGTTSGHVLTTNGTTASWSAPAGGLPTQGSGTTGEMLVSNGTAAEWTNTVTANAANVPALVVRAATGQTEPLQSWQNSSGAQVARIDADDFGFTTTFNGASSSFSSAQMVLNGSSTRPISVTHNPNATGQGSQPMVQWRNSSGVTVSSITADGFISGLPATPANANTAKAVGYIGMPQTIVASGGLILSAAHAGDHIYVTGTGLTITIPANSNAPFEIGTTFVIINANVTTTIAKDISTDILWVAGSATQANTSTRTLAPYGMATIVKIAQVSGGAATWMVSGNGLT